MYITTRQLVGLGIVAIALILLNIYIMQHTEHREAYKVILLLSD